ncbi:MULTISPECIES: shikimate dehydrogenase [unclassified Paludibacterium]|uniref:shikimate dehydrogenase n=1 Tax=unclassified Paludibacterium TaxID=2618429 RepID=UPI001C05AB66|nr:shikimate dehydrogenase [Paludibacterium sp. B53371]BEV72024.1 shikimate dehydrogenase [Paludibacterium sp. THUN1379]
MTERYAVIGNPVDHSQSPFIHAEFARAENRSIRYERLQAATDRFADVVAAFVKTGGCGLNVTLPFKGDAYRLATELSERARAAEAVNTLTFRDGKVFGDNTDGVGLVRDIVENLDFPIAGKRVLILGAGGAVRGVLGPVLQEKPASVTIANRTLIKAEALVHHFEALGLGRCAASAYEQLAGQHFDIVINGTSTSLHNELPPIPHGIFTTRSLAYDMVYSSGLTLFLQRAQSENAGMLADGLGMLVEQAAESFHIWHGVKPETRKVTNMLRELLA